MPNVKQLFSLFSVTLAQYYFRFSSKDFDWSTIRYDRALSRVDNAIVPRDH